MIGIAVPSKHDPAARLAQRRRQLKQRIQHRLQIEGGAD